MNIDAMTAIVLLAALWSVLCRVNQMQKGRTSPMIFAQHLVLGLGIFAALVLAGAVAKLILAASVSFYLLVGAPRWRYAAPPGTETSPGELDEAVAERAGL